MSNAVFVMNRFHLEKYVKKLFKLPDASAYAGVIRKTLQNNNPEAFKKYCKSINKKHVVIRKRSLVRYINISAIIEISSLSM